MTNCNFTKNTVSNSGGAVYFGTGSVANYNDINKPLEPKSRIIGEDGIIRYICGRCGVTYLKSSRCPECGQLVKE